MEEIYFDCASYILEGLEVRFDPDDRSVPPQMRHRRYIHPGVYYQPDEPSIQRAKALYEDLKYFASEFGGKACIRIDYPCGSCELDLLDMPGFILDEATDRERFIALLDALDCCEIYAAQKGGLDLIMYKEAFYEKRKRDLYLTKGHLPPYNSPAGRKTLAGR